MKSNIGVKRSPTLPGVAVAVEIKLESNKLLLVVVCYRAPDDNEFLGEFKNIAQIAGERKYSEVLILGDFNYPNIRWVDGSGFCSHLGSGSGTRCTHVRDLCGHKSPESP